MKRQTRPFIVEVKQKRSSLRQSRSIWGDLDLSSIAAEVMEEGSSIGPSQRLIDSEESPIDADDGNKQQVEQFMADLQDAEPAQIMSEAPANAEIAEVKPKTTRVKKAKAQPKRPAANGVAKAAASESLSSVPAKAPRKVHSAKERAQKLGQIEKLISDGGSIKSATKQAGISEQTYYQWKKTVAPAPEGGELKDLVALEEENVRLKKLLAERLRRENAELKKKLGLD